MKTILSFGETLWDLLPSGPVLGGAPCNLAYRITSLGDAGLLVTRLGHDDLGKKAFERLTTLGMDTRFVQWDDDLPTGTVEVRVGSDGSPDFTINRDTAYDRIVMTSELEEAAAGADALCFGTLAQRSPSNRAALAQVQEACKGVKVLDLNLRRDCHTPETIEASLKCADVLKLNEDEARVLETMFRLTGDSGTAIIRALMKQWDLTCCVVTLGARGAVAFRGNERAHASGARVKVVDTCGSGDAFTAAFLQGYLRGLKLEECCRFGNVLGALVAMQKGATDPVSPDELDRSHTSVRPIPERDAAAFWLR